MSNLDELHFGASSANSDADAFCLQCFQLLRIAANDRLCPGCGAPVRRISAQQRATLSSLTQALMQSQVREEEQEEGNDVSTNTSASTSSTTMSSAAATTRNRANPRRQLQSDMNTTNTNNAGGSDIPALLSRIFGALSNNTGGVAATGGGGGEGVVTTGIGAGSPPLLGLDAALLASLQGAVDGVGSGIGGMIAATLGMGVGGGGNEEDLASRRADPAAIAALLRIDITSPDSATMPHEELPRSCCLHLHHSGLDIVALPASFGPVVKDGDGTHAEIRLVAVDPLDAATLLSPTTTTTTTTNTTTPTSTSSNSGQVGTAAITSPESSPLRNAHLLNGAIAVVERGTVSFATKAKKCAQAGAIAVVVINSKDAVWPYSMTDSKGEGSTIPLVMVCAEDGPKVLQECHFRGTPTGSNSHSNEKSTTTTTTTSSVEAGGLAVLSSSAIADACPICVERFAQGKKVVVMPCQHVFDEECLVRWLDKHSTCPLCRAALPTETDVRAKREREGGGGGGGGGNVGGDASGAFSFAGLQQSLENARAVERERESAAGNWYQ